MKNIILSPMPLKIILINFLTGLVGSILLGLIFIVIGSTYAGNYNFPTIGEWVGWEAGGGFFGVIGMHLGSLAGVLITLKISGYKTKKFLMPITTIILIFLSLLYVNYFQPTFISLIIPAICTTVAATLFAFDK